jgi:hypothetical protein
MFTALAAVLFMLGCGEGKKEEAEVASEAVQSDVEPMAEEAPVAEVVPNVVEIRAVGMTFEGPSEIPSGWTTFKFVNTSDMAHFALIDVPPEGVTAQIFTDTAGQYFQDAMDAMNAGDEEGVNAAFAKFPEWIAHLGRLGGPGMLSPGLTGQTTVYLEPGYYIIECYVKTGGVFHTTSPGDGKLGMMLELTVTDEKVDAPEPTANVTLALRNSGIEISSGALVAGPNTIRVDFIEQQALPSFVGNDVHIMGVASEESITEADEWLDWRNEYGLETPSPVTFYGGINDMPAGTHGYFTVDLAPGDYAFVAELPNPSASGFVLPFTVAAPE